MTVAHGKKSTETDTSAQNLSKVAAPQIISDEEFFKLTLIIVQEWKSKLMLNEVAVEVAPNPNHFRMLTVDKNRVNSLVQKLFLLAVEDDRQSVLVYAKIFHSLVAVASATSARTVRRAILAHCQQCLWISDQMENNSTVQNSNEVVGGRPPEKIQENSDAPRRRTKIFNIHLLGMLYNFEMFPPKVIVDFINVLLANQDEESYERCLCLLLKTTGQKLEKELSQRKQVCLTADAFIPPYNFMRNVFADLKDIANVSQTLRLDLQNLIELRDNNWIPKTKVNDPAHGDCFEPHVCDEFVQELYQQLLSAFSQIRAEFPGDKVFFIVAGLAKQVVTVTSLNFPNYNEGPQMAGKLIKILISQGHIQRDAVLWILSQGILPKMTDNDSLKVARVSQFILEIFGSEPNLNWLSELIQNVGLGSSSTKEKLVTMTLKQLQLQSGDKFVQLLLSETENAQDFIPVEWLPSSKVNEKICSATPPIDPQQILTRLKNGDLDGLINVFQTESTAENSNDILRVTLMAVCDLCFVDGAWDSLQLDTWLSVLSAQAKSRSISGDFSNLWKSAVECLRQKHARSLDELFLWNRLMQFNLVPNEN